MQRSAYQRRVFFTPYAFLMPDTLPVSCVSAAPVGQDREGEGGRKRDRKGRSPHTPDVVDARGRGDGSILGVLPRDDTGADAGCGMAGERGEGETGGDRCRLHCCSVAGEVGGGG